MTSPCPEGSRRYLSFRFWPISEVAAHVTPLSSAELTGFADSDVSSSPNFCGLPR